MNIFQNSPLKLIYSIYEVKGTKRVFPEEENSEETTKHPRLSSDTEETDAYSESESQDGLSHVEVTKKDSNENHIVQNNTDKLQNNVNNSVPPEQNRTVNGYYHDDDLPVDLSNHKSKASSHDNKKNGEKKDMG